MSTTLGGKPRLMERCRCVFGQAGEMMVGVCAWGFLGGCWGARVGGVRSSFGLRVWCATGHFFYPHRTSGFLLIARALVLRIPTFPLLPNSMVWRCWCALSWKFQQD